MKKNNNCEVSMKRGGPVTGGVCSRDEKRQFHIMSSPECTTDLKVRLQLWISKGNL